MARKTRNAGKAQNLKKLNWYHLQKAMYAAWARFDQAATKEEGRQQIKAVYEEYAQRGVAKVLRPAQIQ